MKKVFKILMWIALSFMALVTIVLVIFFNWQTISNLRIGLKMQSFTETKTQWTDIDFTMAVEAETPYISNINHKNYPALEKYRINGIYAIKNNLLAYGSDEEDVIDKWDVKFGIPLTDENFVEKNEQAYIFRSTDNGKSFEKISLGHGTISYVTGTPIFTNNTLYIQVDERDTKKVRYYRSEDLGKTWVLNDWKPSFAWSDGAMFIENEENKSVTMSQDHGQTWHSLENALKSFYDKTHSLRQLNDHVLVGMTMDKKILSFDLKTNKEDMYKLSIPEGKVIGGFGTNTIHGKTDFYIELYDNISKPDDEYAYLNTQESIWFPLSDEYIQLPKKLPYPFYWDVKENYIGGIMHYGDDVFGTIVHVYTLDRGKHWSYEILDKYNLMTASAYIDGQFWFVASKDSAGGVFLTKGKIE